MAGATIDQLIINSPFEEPSSYWSYERETRSFTRNCRMQARTFT